MQQKHIELKSQQSLLRTPIDKNCTPRLHQQIVNSFNKQSSLNNSLPTHLVTIVNFMCYTMSTAWHHSQSMRTACWMESQADLVWILRDTTQVLQGYYISTSGIIRKYFRDTTKVPVHQGYYTSILGILHKYSWDIKCCPLKCLSTILEKTVTY